MEKKLDIKELEKQCLEAEKIFNTLNEQLIQAQIEEEKVKQAKLEAEKDKRRKEIEETEDKLIKLKSAYVKDYGYYYSSKPYDVNTINSLLHWLV